MDGKLMEIVSRSDARAKGQTWYFTGKVCVHGHVTTRNVRNGTCHRCTSDKVAIWQKNNPDRVKQNQDRWQEKNPGLSAKRVGQWYQENKERAIVANKMYKARNKDLMQFLSSKYRALRLLRVPKWLDDADYRMIRHAYKFAAEKTRETGVEWEVDHILPLQGKYVSGLHTWQNLRVIPAVDNNRKNNHFTPYSMVHEG